MNSLRMVTAATIGGALVFGMTLALFGSLKLALARRLQLSDGHARRLLVALQVGLIPLMLLCGLFLDLSGARAILLAGSVVLALALVSLSLRPEYPQAFASILLAGLGAAAVGTAAVVLMPLAFFSSAETSASLNLGYAFIALGALLTSVLADILLDVLGLRRTLAAFALLALTPALLAVFATVEPGVSDEGANLTALFGEASGCLAILAFFLYAPLEASVSLWTLRLMSERGQDEREAGRWLTGFWVAFVGSRLLTAWGQHADFLPEMWDRWIVAVAPLLAAAAVGNLSGASHRERPGVALVLLGLLLGPVFPTLLGMVFRHVTAAEWGLAYGIAFAAGSLGSLLLSPFVGVRPPSSPRLTVRAPIFLALLLTAATLVLGLLTP